MMFSKSNSTGKSKSKQTQPIRITEYSTCPKLKPNSSNKKDYVRPQPIKIAQLLCESKNLRKAENDSVRKKILPEKLGQPLSIKSGRLNEKQNAKGTKKESTCFNNRVRRNLNFNDISATKINNESENKSNQYTDDQLISKEISESVKRKSLLLPPNTIKERHLKKFTNESSKYSKLPQLSKKIVPINEKTDAYTCSKIKQKDTEIKEIDISLSSNELPKENNILQSQYKEASNKCEIVTTSNCRNLQIIDAKQPDNFGTPHIITESVVPSECSTYQNDNCMQTQPLHKKMFIQNEINSENEVFIDIKDDNNIVDNSCNDFQDTGLMESESNTNVKCIPSKVICVDKNDIIRLERDLRNLLSATEKNVSKIKSTLTCVTRLLSTNENNIIGNEHCSQTMGDKEVQVENCKLVQRTEENSKMPILHNPQITVTATEHDTNKSIESSEDDKENYETVNAKHISDITNSTVQDCYIQQKTPTSIPYKQEQTFREYMVLKSTMSFLETPDIKKFRCLHRNENTDTSVVNKTHISHKVLTDLLNLYSDSPESVN